MISPEISNQMCVQVYQQDWCPTVVSKTNMFIILPAYFIVLSPVVPSQVGFSEVLDQEQFACIISLIFLIFLKQ